MKTLNTHLWILCFALLFSAAASAQKSQSYQSLLGKAEALYDIGKYDKALKENLRVARRISDKLSDNPLYTAWNATQRAKNYEAMGKFQEMNESIAEAKNLLNSIKNENPDEYLLAMSRIAEIYNTYGNPLKAIQLLSEASSVQSDNSYVVAALSQQKAQAYYSWGGFQKAHNTIDSLITLRKSLIEDKALAAQLSKNRRKSNKQQLAQLYTLKARVYIKSGFYEQADSVLNASNVLVRRSLGVTSTGYMKHLIAFAEIYDAQENFSKAIDYTQMAQRAHEFYEDTYREQSKTYLQLQENKARSSIYNKSFQGFQRSRINELKRIAKKNYGEESVPYLRGLLVEAERFIFRRDIKEAQEILEAVVAKPKEVLPEDHEVRVRAVELLAQVYTKNDANIKQADQIHRDWLDAQQKRLPLNSFEYKTTMIKVGYYYSQYSEEFQEAKKIFEEVPYEEVQRNLNVAQQDYIKFTEYYAAYYQNNDRFQKAYEVLESARALLEQKYGAKSVKVANELRNVANVQTLLGNYRQAESNINEALEIIKNNFTVFSVEYADALAKMARIYSIIGDYQLAEGLIKQSNEIYKKLEKDPEITENINLEAFKAESAEDLASLYIRIGEYNSTETLLKDIISRKESKYGTQSRKLIYPLQQYGYLFYVKGDYGNAEKNTRRAENIAATVYGKKSLAYNDSKELLANIQAALGDFDRAEMSLKESMEIQKEILGPYHIKNATLLTELALIQFAANPQQNAKVAEEALDNAKKIVEATFDNKHPQYAEALKNLAMVYAETERYEEATQFIDQANAIWKSKFGENNINSAGAYSLKGDVALRQSQLDAAESHYRQAKDLYKGIFDEQHPGYVRNLGKLGRVFYQKKDYAQATSSLDESTQEYLRYIQKYFPSLSEREKAKYWALIQPDFEFYRSLALAQLQSRPEMMGKVYDHVLATKAILLSSSIKIREKILLGSNEDLKQKYQSWLEKKEYFTTVLSMGNEERRINGIDIQALETDIELLEKALSEESDIFSDYKATTWKDVRASLREGEEALEMVRFRLYTNTFSDSILYLALKVSPGDTLPKAMVLRDGKVMETGMLAYYRNTTKARLNNRFSYKTYWQPLEDFVGKPKLLFFSPDGAYNQLNVESLLNPTTGRYVIEDLDIALIANTKDLLQRGKQTQNTSKSITLFGNPDYYEQKVSRPKVASLPGTQVEVESIRGLFEKQGYQISYYTEAKASENNVKETNSPKILHIATHGFFAPNLRPNSDIGDNSILQNPLMKSGLLFASAGDIFESAEASLNYQEGVLTAYEAMNMNLEQTDLVILSACETGVGEVQIGEGVFGLQRAFQIAGAKTIVMSLFKVNDEVTQKLMVAFYGYLLSGESKRTAFHKAKMEIKQSYKEPVYWGSFVMLGVD